METKLKRGVALLDVPDPVAKDSIELANNVAKTLGYRALASSVTTAAVIRNQTLKINKVLAALRAEGIELFPGIDVAEYKEEMVTDLTLKARRSRKDKMYTWNSTYLKDYNQPVPEFVLARALQVYEILAKEQLGTPGFMVEFLQENDTRRTEDPFLCFSLDGCGVNAKFYLEVWDEPTFEGVRQI